MSVTLANAGAKDRNSTDFYPTPAEVTVALLRFLNQRGYVNVDQKILESAAGEGHMVRAMESEGYKVVANDLYTHNKVDFLAQGSEHNDVDWIITNPPFRQAEAFIRKAIELRPHQGVAMLLKSQYWHASTRLKLFEEFNPSHVLPLTWRPDFLFGAKSSSPTMEVLWTVWITPYTGVARNTTYRPLQKPKLRSNAI
jgi:hypothetical protein